MGLQAELFKPISGKNTIRTRFSDPYLNRFLQPDSIIPNLYNPQDLNRYSYVGNNAINRTDPTGHKACDDEYGCFGRQVSSGNNGSGNDAGDASDRRDKSNKRTEEIGVFQIFPASNFYSYGKSAEENYSGYSGGGDPNYPLLNYNRTNVEIQSSGSYVAGLMSVVNDMLIGYQRPILNQYTAYDQHVYINYSVQYVNVPQVNAMRIVKVTGVQILNSSRELLNYIVSVETSSKTLMSNTFSAGPGETVSAHLSGSLLTTNTVNIQVRAFSGCVGPCIRNVNPSSYNGYGNFSSLP